MCCTSGEANPCSMYLPPASRPRLNNTDSATCSPTRRCQVDLERSGAPPLLGKRDRGFALLAFLQVLNDLRLHLRELTVDAILVLIVERLRVCVCYSWRFRS